MSTQAAFSKHLFCLMSLP